MKNLDFLTIGPNHIRNAIKDIDDSYRNSWDLLAELAQNSVDAIHKLGERGEIDITIDTQKNRIIFEDNGCGIPAAELPNLLTPFGTDKKNDSSAIGEKGVGLTFVLFQTAFFEIRTSDGKTKSTGVVKDARYWKTRTDNCSLQLEYESYSEKPTRPGTKITIEGIESDRSEDVDLPHSLFDLTKDQLLFLLRTKTAIGNTDILWENDVAKIKVALHYIDKRGIESSETVESSYQLPTETSSPETLVDVEKFREWSNIQDRSDAEKRSYLNGKVLTIRGTNKDRASRDIKYYLCYVPKRSCWDDLTVKSNLASSENIEDETWRSSHNEIIMEPGIYIATKGMPTGISIETPVTGAQSYWSNIFLLLQDDALSFDIGRKSIQGKTKRIYKEIAKELFREIMNLVQKYTAGTNGPDSPIGQEFDRIEIKESLDRIVDLKSEKTKFKKNPNKQEAAVSAIFFEMIGNGTINDIEPIYLGYRQKYDLYAYHMSKSNKRKFGFYEFKSKLRNITKDFHDAKKVFDELDYIICWDVTDEDIQKLSEFGIDCTEYRPSDFDVCDVPKSVTHVLALPNVNPVYVIDLKSLVLS